MVQANFSLNAVATSGLNQVVAGAGRDFLTFVTGTSAGTFTMPTLNYVAFTPVATNSWESNSGDRLILVAQTAFNLAVTLNAAAGLDILQAAKEQDSMTPVILMTAQASLQSAIAAVNSGAYHYIQKPFSNDELVAILRRACDYRAVKVENKQLKQEIRKRERGGGAVSRPIGKSKRFLEALRLAEHVAPTDSTVPAASLPGV